LHHYPCHPRALPPFPTRRSSDLKDHDRAAFEPFVPLREQLEGPFRDRVFLWPRKGGKDGDLVADEMNRVLQVPGWSNIFTMPIRSEEHTSELQSQSNLVCRLLLE